MKVHTKSGPYRHCLQDLLDYMSSISLTVVASLHNPDNKETHSANETEETHTVSQCFLAFSHCMIMNNSAISHLKKVKSSIRYIYLDELSGVVHQHWNREVQKIKINNKIAIPTKRKRQV